MKVAFLHPTYWPEVRRGSERLIHDLGAGLAARGHEVTLFTTHEGTPSRSVEDGIEVARGWRAPYMRPLRWYEDHITNVPLAAWRLWRADFDLAHAFFPAEAWAAMLARRHLGGPPFIFSIHGIPIRKYLVERRYRLSMQRATVDEAAAVTVLSEAARAATRRYLLHDPTVLPGGVRCADFAVSEPLAETPTIVCAASLRDPRKRPELLLDAFARLRERRPDAELVLIRPRDPLIFSWDAPERPPGVTWLEAADTEALARAYARAWASVLPAVDEAFGLVLVESLAAGTPVVAARSGACPEIVTGDETGRLFEPDDAADLERAMDEALELGATGEAADACRERAADYDLERALDACERIYGEAIGA